MSEGDFVFTVGTKGEPTSPPDRGRVLGVYQVSSLEVNTQDYVGQIGEVDVVERVASKFPFALYPIAAWEITAAANVFSAIAGPLTGAHHLQAQSTVVELDADTGAALLALERRPVALAEPTTLLGRGLVAQKNSKLTPKHEGEFSGRFGEHDIWYVYALALRDQRGRDLAFKIGYASDPAARLAAHNAPMASKVIGLTWQLALKQPTSSEDDARLVEQALLAHLARQKLPSNGEIFAGPSESAILSAIAVILLPS
ncbi:GIY-YIG nuclease family protein [Devosia neptuniae]|uniref:GIY-YIG nuclease family protein n=1 Tax=Devosia neptuniae TaxID=191302 RepID=UPI0022AEF7A7|nr:GIY-YIG nuclease family protein [Devosia neptuniae]MCZ4345537.1 GIY-YIG nuclease family protein [Devosia neptuniae]